MIDFSKLFSGEKLLALQLGDALLIRADNGWAVCLDNPLNKLFDLRLGLLDLPLEQDADLTRLSQARVPRILEHHFHKLK